MSSRSSFFEMRNMVAYLFAGRNDLVMWEKLIRKERTIAEIVLAKAREVRMWYIRKGFANSSYTQ